jgi:AraC-like DNA-binding protein
MPQDRTVLHTGPDLSIERVRSHPAATEWSGVYATETQRFVLPMTDVGLDIRAYDETWLVDGLTAMRLSSNLAYQVRPGRPSMRESLVVSGGHLGVCGAEPAFWLLCPRTLFRVHMASRQEVGGTTLAETAFSLVGQVSRGNELPPLRGAVARARRLLVTAPDTFARASLHDIADASAVSTFHLARSFRSQTGLSLHQYRLRLRLAAVLARLSGGEHDLPGLAHDHGFCSQSHLGAVFLREVGVTPSLARLAFATR